jgi:predicted nucleotidyltransferase/DNA-binding XRE family transcriptional regulator
VVEIVTKRYIDDMPSSAELIHEARIRAGLTQAQLADRAGMTQSVISAYESGHREPSLPMLRKLVDVSGSELVIELAPPSTHPLLDRLTEHRAELVHELERLGAHNVRVFGSVARGDENPQSDIDLLVDLNASAGLFALAQMRSVAETILRATVDVVPADSLKDDAAATILSEARSL